MSTCKKIRRVSKKVCIGALKRKVDLYTRSIIPPSGSSVDFDEDFTTPVRLPAMVETVSGKTIFDETNTEQIITHNVYIRYRAGITSENWLSLISKTGGADVYLNIRQVEDLNEENRWLKLMCNLRGNTNIAANFA